MAMEIAAIFLCIVSVSDQNVPDTMLCKWDVYRYVIRPGEDSLSPQVWKLAPSVTCGHHGDDECPLSFRSREETEVLSPRVSQVHDIVSIIQLATCPRPPPPACWEVEDSERPLGRGPSGLHRPFVISLRSTRSHWCGCWWRVCDRFRKTEPWEQELKSKSHSIHLYSDIKALGYEPDNFLQFDLFFSFFRLLNLAN